MSGLNDIEPVGGDRKLSEEGAEDRPNSQPAVASDGGGAEPAAQQSAIATSANVR
jgi:hypothetical protein